MRQPGMKKRYLSFLGVLLLSLLIPYAHAAEDRNFNHIADMPVGGMILPFNAIRLIVIVTVLIMMLAAMAAARARASSMHDPLF